MLLFVVSLLRVFNKLSSLILYMTSISNHFGMQVRIKKNYQHIISIFLIISLVLVRAVVI
jgi:Mg2+ and Co2+ transporter CorA